MSDRDDVTRRTVLSKGAATTVALGVGTAAFAGTGTATSCPRTPGYWMNHDWPSTWRNVNERIDEIDFGSVAEGQAFLGEPKRGDKGQIMAVHLVATILNFQNQSPGSPCLTTGVRDVDGDGHLESVGDGGIKPLAQEWLNTSDWTPENPLRTWTVPGATVPDGEVLKDGLDDFNNNRFDLEGCGCE